MLLHMEWVLLLILRISHRSLTNHEGKSARRGGGPTLGWRIGTGQINFALQLFLYRLVAQKLVVFLEHGLA